MRIFTLLTLSSFLLSSTLWAEAPECPSYPTRQDCLASIDDNLERALRLIDEEYGDKEKNPLILAALDVSYLESQACLKTCLN